MAKQEQAAMPSTQGGLVQYFDADTGTEIDPKTIIGMGAGVVVIELALHLGILA